MTTPTGEYMDSLAARGVVFGLDGDALVIDAPAGVLTATDRAQLRARRDHLRWLLRCCLPPEAFAAPAPPREQRRLAEVA